MQKIISYIIILLFFLNTVSGLQINLEEPWEIGKKTPIKIQSNLENLEITIIMYDIYGNEYDTLKEFERKNGYYTTEYLLPYNYPYNQIDMKTTILKDTPYYQNTKTIQVKQLNFIEKFINWVTSYLLGKVIF